MYNQPSTLSQIQEREADIRALAELSRALDKKASATRLEPCFRLSLLFADGDSCMAQIEISIFVF